LVTHSAVIRSRPTADHRSVCVIQVTRKAAVGRSQPLILRFGRYFFVKLRAMRISPPNGAPREPFDYDANPAPVRAFPLTPLNKLFEPFRQYPGGSAQQRLDSFLSPSDETASAMGRLAAVDGLAHRSRTFDSIPHFASDTPIRPVLPRLTTWPHLHYTGSRAAEHEPEVVADVETAPSKRYARYDNPDKASPGVDYRVAVEIPQRHQPATTSPTNLSNPPQRSKPVKSTRRREQCRANQARYRERQKHKLWVKEEEVACLRELVNLLEAQCSGMRARSWRCAFAHHIVVELFRRFRNGFSGARPSNSAESIGFAVKSQPLMPTSWEKALHVEKNLILVKQIAFVRTIINKDADVGNGRLGSDAVLEQLWRHSTIFANLNLELISVKEEYSFDSQIERVVATGSLKVIVTEQTIVRVFPDLPPRLHHMLLGATLNYSLRLRLDLEETDTPPLLQVTKLHAELDVVSALLDVLRDPAAVERVMRYARISSDGVIGDLETLSGMRWS